MGLGNLYGKKGKNIMDFINLIKKMDLGFIFGRMINFLLDFGKMGNKMDMESMLKGMLLSLVCGIMGKKKKILMKRNFL